MEKRLLTEILHLQINLIQDDDGIAELNPDEFFNNILRTLRDAIDGNFVIQILIVRSKTGDVTFLVDYLYIYFLLVQPQTSMPKMYCA